jgi:hypothetical protein
MTKPLEYVLRKPKNYIWKPLASITAYELAECMPMLLSCMTMAGAFQAEALFDYLSAEAQRHWSIEG